MKALFLFILFVAEAIGTIDKCSAKMTTPNLCGAGKTCDYKANMCKKFAPEETCLNNNNMITGRPPLLESNIVAIFKLKVTNPTTARAERCNLPDNKYLEDKALPLVTGDETRLARAAVEILDAIYWLSEINANKQCVNMRRFTLSIAEMSDNNGGHDKIYLAGNLDFAGVGQKWRTFELEKPGVKLAIQYILKKWDFPTDQVFVLKMIFQYMQRHAEMQLVSFAKNNGKTITQLGVSKPPCCKCDAGLTEGGYKLADTMEVFSGPGTHFCGRNRDGPWCGSQYGYSKTEFEFLGGWVKPQNIKKNQVTETNISI